MKQNWYNYFLLVTFAVCIIQYTNGQEERDSNPCVQATTCEACMQANPDCYWCRDVNYTEGENFSRDRCNLLIEFNDGCANLTSISSAFEPGQNSNFSDTVQVQPQTVTLDLRPGQPAVFNISVKPAPDFPVDIYFLFDASFSMKDDLEKLEQLGAAIAQSINNITKNYRLGFGTFVDKKAVPFVEGPLFPTFPCSRQVKVDNCAPVFPFRHTFSFSKNTTLFQQAVADQPLSGDLDRPEGSFDGLMQVVVCDQKIGWQPRGKARRIVLLATDALPKIAGDGRLIGDLLQNDETCHLSPLNSDRSVLEYSESLTMDYPSISQLREAMKKYEITPIIAVTEDVQDVYKDIANSWESLLAAFGVLNNDSSNIVDLVRENYKKISSTVRLLETKNEYLDFEYKQLSPECQETLTSPNECEKVAIGQQVDFQVSVTLKKCPPEEENAANRGDIDIPGFGQVKINLNYLCTCPCSNNAIPNSVLCNTTGSLDCGICKCNQGFFGSKCECDETTVSRNDTLKCQSDQNDPSFICSNQGICLCGVCDCFRVAAPRIISGKYCECKNFGCPKSRGQECGGDERGTCVCGQCKCKKEYAGVDCGNFNCTEIEGPRCTKDGVQCSNRGFCDCTLGGCNCNQGYQGKYCEKCVTKNCKCNDLRNCVLCKAYDRDDLNCTGCEYLDLQRVNDTQKTCTVQFNETCSAYYHYEIDPTQNQTQTQNVTVYLEDDFFCVVPIVAGEPNSLWIILGIIAGIVLIGLLLLLIWKLLLILQGRREYNKFETSRTGSQWEQDQNPIYAPPDQKFDNPVFGGEF